MNPFDFTSNYQSLHDFDQAIMQLIKDKNSFSEFPPEQNELSDFLGFAGFGHGENAVDMKLPAPSMQVAIQKDFVKNHSVKQRYASFLYLFLEEQLDDLASAAENGTTTSTASAISKFDNWFAVLPAAYYNVPAKHRLKSVVEKMLAMDVSLPAFIRVCQLVEEDRGVVLAHFTQKAQEVNGRNLKANSKGLLMTAFQRAFRMYDAKHNINTLSTMTTWKKNPNYKHVKNQCLEQLKIDASIPLADQKKTKTIPMDMKTYKSLLEYLSKKQSETFGVNLQDFCYYINADFAARTLMFGGPRGSSELANLPLKAFVKLEHDMLHFLQSGITKANQTGGDTNFSVKIKPDLYFIGANLVSIFELFHKRSRDADGSLKNHRLFLKPLPSATFLHDEWFGNVHVGKNNINYVSYITHEMQQAGLIPPFLKYDNTSLRKVRTQALTDAGIEDWMLAESMGQKDTKFQNLSYYRKMDHQDKINMAKVLADPWVYTKKRSIVDVIDGSDYAAEFGQENLAPKNFCVNIQPSRPVVQDGPVQMPAVDPMQELQKTVQLNNCSNVVVNVYLAK